MVSYPRRSGFPAAARLLNEDASSKRCSAPLRGEEHRLSDRSATISSPIPPTAGPAPTAAKPPAAAAARTKLLLEGPVFSTLLRLSAPNVFNLLAFAGMVTFDGFFLGQLGSDALAGASLVFPWVM